MKITTVLIKNCDYGFEKFTTCNQRSYTLVWQERNFMVPTFPDGQNSLTFPVFFSIFPVCLLCFVFQTENLIFFSK